jgi:hypothetical protein
MNQIDIAAHGNEITWWDIFQRILDDITIVRILELFPDEFRLTYRRY